MGGAQQLSLLAQQLFFSFILTSPGLTRFIAVQRLPLYHPELKVIVSAFSRYIFLSRL